MKKKVVKAQVQPVVRPNDLYFVIAGSITQAEYLAWMENILRCNLRCISRPEQLRGIDGVGKILHKYGTWYRNPYADQIIEIAKQRGWEILSV